jgi:anti-sigma factor (TIGR02949 family)
VDCEETQDLLHGYLDGELDVVNSMALTQHLHACPACTQAYEAQRALRTAVRTSALYFAPPRSLQKQVRAAVRRAYRADTRPPWWTLGGLSLGVAMAVVVLLVWGGRLLQVGPVVDEHVLQDVIAGHVRSLMANHLTDVMSADQHTVKPWFEGHMDFAPPVPDLTAQGFPLVGGRLDYFDNRPVAALVYRRQQHVINLFVWPAPPVAAGAESTVTRHGYNLVQWTTAGMTYWAISTLNAQEMQAFAHMIQPYTPPPPPSSQR